MPESRTATNGLSLTDDLALGRTGVQSIKMFKIEIEHNLSIFISFFLRTAVKLPY